jgi:two-component system chemotaxis sensor kinase CheA
MSDKEAVRLIFTAGLSTAKKVTNVSGRGVGMDVVRANIERIGGTVDLQSEFGQGTTLTVKIPLTLAIIPALMVSTAGQRFAIPQINVVELVGLDGKELAQGIETVRKVEVYRLRGALLPIIRLTDVLGVPRNGQELKSAYLVVLSSGNEQIGLLVDWVHDTEEIVVKPLSKHLKHLKAYAGATILGDGRVALILDVGGIVASVGLEFESVQEGASLEARKEAAAGEELREILLFRLGSDQQFAIPLGLVNRLEEFNRDEIETTSGREVIQYRGDLLPLIRPGNLLNVAGGMGEEKSVLPAVVFSIEDKQVGFIVTEILDIQEVVLEFSRASVAEEGVLGTAIVNGKATQFLDAYSLLELAIPDWFGRTGEQRFGEGKRALLVDDSAFYRSMIGSYLEAAGYEVVEASNGEEGLKQLERFEFSVILTDIEMPVMDGFDLIRNVGELEIYRHIPIVVLSIHAKPAYRERASGLGVAAYLVKLDRTELLKTLEGLLAERTET